MQSSNTMLEVWSPSKQQQLLWTCSQTKFSRSWQKAAQGLPMAQNEAPAFHPLGKTEFHLRPILNLVWWIEFDLDQLLSHVVRDSSACVGHLWITVTEKWLRRIIWPAPTVPWGQRVTRCFPFALRKTARSGSLRWVVQEIGQAHLILREVTCSMSENIES